MDIITLRDYCINKSMVTEHFPFDQQTLVFKVANKMFALCNIDNFCTVNLKCDPERALELRTHHPEIIPGYHMSKTHWNTVDVTKNLSHNLVFELIDHSYDLVVASMPKKIQEEIRKNANPL